jgi:outer membrane protein OmpA-like peptidoglycan-associated protein
VTVRRRHAVALPLAVTLAGLGGPAAAAEQPLPSPRVVTLRPRVVQLEKRVVDLRPKQRHRTVTVDADVLFAFDSARLSAGASDVLDDVVRTLAARHARSATIVGYTDSVGSASYNQGLSERRARAVRDYLRGRPETARIRYRVVGRGERDPVAANTQPNGRDNPLGRRKNRRVTIAYA